MSARLCRFEELDDGGVRRFDVGDLEIALVRVGDEVFALADECSHQKVSLSEGEFDRESFSLECPKHGSGFCVRTGEALALPATRPVATYEVSVDAAGDVVLEVPGE